MLFTDLHAALLRTQRAIVEVEALAHLASPSEAERLHRKVRRMRNDADGLVLSLL
jgi:hypothetical protein